MGRRACLAALLLRSAPAAGIELLEGRVQVHARALVRDFDPDEQLDLSQWAQILDLELEVDIAPAKAQNITANVFIVWGKQVQVLGRIPKAAPRRSR